MIFKSSNFYRWCFPNVWSDCWPDSECNSFFFWWERFRWRLSRLDPSPKSGLIHLPRLACWSIFWLLQTLSPRYRGFLFAMTVVMRWWWYINTIYTIRCVNIYKLWNSNFHISSAFRFPVVYKRKSDVVLTLGGATLNCCWNCAICFVRMSNCPVIRHIQKYELYTLIKSVFWQAF